MIDDLHGRSVVADTHNDLLDAIAHRPVERWVPHFRERWLPQLQAGGVNLQVLPVFVDDVFRPEGALRQTLRMIEAAHRIAEANQDTVRLCLDGAEIDEALGEDRIALVLALESAPGVGEDVELLETLFRLGVRVASWPTSAARRWPTAAARTPPAAGSPGPVSPRWPRWNASA